VKPVPVGVITVIGGTAIGALVGALYGFVPTTLFAFSNAPTTDRAGGVDMGQFALILGAVAGAFMGITASVASITALAISGRRLQGRRWIRAAVAGAGAMLGAAFSFILMMTVLDGGASSWAELPSAAPIFLVAAMLAAGAVLLLDRFSEVKPDTPERHP
jgi:MFS family permease